MSRFVLEALFIGGKEGIKLSLCALLLFSLFPARDRSHLKRAAAAGIFMVFLTSFFILPQTVTFEIRGLVVKMIGYVFGIFYFFSIAALFHETGTDVLGPLRPVVRNSSFQVPAVMAAVIVYFIPDMAGSSLFVADLASMAPARGPVLFAAGAGFAVAATGVFAAGRNYPAILSRMFGLPQLVLTLALIKLLAGGVRGFAEFTLIPAVQAGLMKLIHDVVHQVFVLILVPDHPILSTTTWTFVGVLFQETAGLWLSLLLLLAPLALFVGKHFREPMDVPAEITRPAGRRLMVRAIRDRRVLKSIPVFCFMIVIVSIWFVQRDEPGVSLYLPDARPVAAEGGALAIPLQAPGRDLRDGSLHKFALTLGGEQVRLVIMKKPDGTLAVCLDACEICPPEGYGQSREHVVCLYCKTPIPFDTLGKPGGCNPIPLVALVTDTEVRLSMTEIAAKWALVKSGKGRLSPE